MICATKRRLPTVVNGRCRESAFSCGGNKETPVGALSEWLKYSRRKRPLSLCLRIRMGTRAYAGKRADGLSSAMAGLLTNSFTLTVLPIATETIPGQATSLTLLRNPTKPLTQSKRQSVRGDRLRALLRFFPFSRKPSARRRHRGQGLLPLRAAQMYICAMLARAFPPCKADNFPFREPSNSSPLRSRHNRPLTRIAPIGPREFSSLRSG